MVMAVYKFTALAISWEDLGFNYKMGNNNAPFKTFYGAGTKYSCRMASGNALQEGFQEEGARFLISGTAG